MLRRRGRDDERGPQFHALFQFQLLGINGAFLTGDLFNLFVFFEVLLIASYALLLHGLGRAACRRRAARRRAEPDRLRAVPDRGRHAVRRDRHAQPRRPRARDAALEPDDAPLARSGALLLLVVFALKAALLPLGFWLPRAYAAATGAIAALFAVLTKVGVYAILRVYPLVFGAERRRARRTSRRPGCCRRARRRSPSVRSACWPRARCARSAGWMVVYSVGTLLVAVGLFSEAGYAAAIYYTAHSTLASAALFLVADLVARQRSAGGDRLDVVDAMPHGDLLGSLFFVAAVTVAGLPPLSGFVGKIADPRRVAAGAGRLH